MKPGPFWSRRPLAAALLVLAAASAQMLAPAPAEAAGTELSYTTAGTWRPDLSAGKVHVALRVVATSHAEDSATRRYFYPGLQLTLPASTSGYRATDDAGKPLPIAIRASSAYGVVIYVTFGQRLYSGQTGSFNLDFDVVDPGGSTDRDLHIGRDLVSFPVCAFGSVGTPGSTVTVIFPPGFTVQEQFGSLTSGTGEDGEVVYTSGPIGDPTALNAWFTGYRTVPASDFRVRYVTVPPMQVALRYWSDDPGWADQVERVLESGYPVLRDLVGLGDPPIRSLTIEEATSQGIGGFSGEYDQSGGVIRVSYFADPMVILHEIAHLWFDSQLASDRWIDEGFASYYAEQAVLALGLPDHAPALSDALMRVAVPLDDWTAPGTPGSAEEAYLYGASLNVARRVADVAGPARLRLIWQSVWAGVGPYEVSTAGGAPTPDGLGVGNSGASGTAGDPSPDPSAGPQASPSAGPGGTLAPGSSAGSGPLGGPAVPLDWRRLLDYLDQVTGASFGGLWIDWVVTPDQAPLLERHDSLLTEYRQGQALAGGWQMPVDVREALTDWRFDQAEAMMSQCRGVLAMRAEIDKQARNQSTVAPPTLRTEFESGSLTAADLEARRELAVLSSLSAASSARTTNDGARVVGLLGANPDADLANARKAFGQGDLEEAERLAESARSAWAGAAGAEQVRVLGLGASLGGVLLLMLALYLSSHRPVRPRTASDGRA